MGYDSFLIARNPEEDSKLPYLLHLPIEGGLVLKARDTWPRAARIYCHPYEAPLARWRRGDRNPGRVVQTARPGDRPGA